ncbi:regulatory protein ToxS [Photobacterium nomapromontoriensis]|uniref:regulatory protein ToxS n=1 Tax=Photobacterium nomapromontoriensis TaxID=2910237 RepID=UPI003D0E7B8F
MSVMNKLHSALAIVMKYWAFILLAFSVIFSAWLYYVSDYKQEQLLMSLEWQTTTISRIEPTKLDELRMLRQVEQTSHMIYLPNHTYSRITKMKLFSDNTQPLVLHITELGNWDISGGYLQTEPLEFKDMTSGQNQDFQPKQLQIIKQIYRMDAQQSRRIDIINDKSILLTSLDYGSNILYSL